VRVGERSRGEDIKIPSGCDERPTFYWTRRVKLARRPPLPPPPPPPRSPEFAPFHLALFVPSAPPLPAPTPAPSFTTISTSATSSANMSPRPRLLGTALGGAGSDKRSSRDPPRTRLGRSVRRPWPYGLPYALLSSRRSWSAGLSLIREDIGGVPPSPAKTRGCRDREPLLNSPRGGRIDADAPGAMDPMRRRRSG